MTGVTCELVDCGVDWITGTGPASGAIDVAVQKAGKWLKDEELRGFEIKPWCFSEYRGFAAGSVALGQRHDGYIFRLGSHMAQRHWRDVFMATRKATRLDLQYTLRFNVDPQQIISRSYRQVKRSKRKQPKGPSHSLFAASDKSSTLYLGSRSSETFGRLYDKGRESGSEFFRNCVRLETELKGETANSYAHHLFRSDDEQADIISQVSTFVQERGVSPWLTKARRPHVCAALPPTDIERRLRWLTTGVGPTVRWLVERCGVDPVLKALGLIGPDGPILKVCLKPHDRVDEQGEF
jgi:DNA relaxase NicK